MTEKGNLKVKTVSTTSPTVEVPTNQKTEQVAKKLTTLTGITTSQVNSGNKAHRTNGQHPYPARVFLKIEGQETDIPIFFRIKENGNWVRPKIKAGSHLTVQGVFKDPDQKYNQNRPSFTAYSYQILDLDLAPKLILAEAESKLPQFEQALTNIRQIREQLSHGK